MLLFELFNIYNIPVIDQWKALKLPFSRQHDFNAVQSFVSLPSTPSPPLIILCDHNVQIVESAMQKFREKIK